MKHVDDFFRTARERYNIKLNREAGLPPADWTADPIFPHWRFCNVHREHDRTTRWFKEHVRDHVHGLRAVEATVAFRWFNKIETGQKVLDLLKYGWNAEEAEKRLEGIEPITTGAYMIRSPHDMPKLQGILKCVEDVRALLPPLVAKWGESLREAHADLVALPYLGRFYAYEIVTDLRWTGVLLRAEDILTWASAGPGCARGLSRVMGEDVDHLRYGSNKDQGFMLSMMKDILEMSRDPLVWPMDWEPWEMREVEHWACEFDKYERARGGERLKRRFP